jgi:hypothetical protein
MARLLICAATVAIAAIGAAGLVTSAPAQPYAPGYQPGYQPGPSYYYQRERTREREREHARDDGRRLECKNDRVVASGSTRPTYGWARSSAEAKWSTQVRVDFGEEWSDIRSARDYVPRCFPVALGKRCEIGATPCREPSLLGGPH